MSNLRPEHLPYGAADASEEGHAVAPDVTRSTTFAYEDAERVRALAAGEAGGEFYPRYGHPNARGLESAVARLEGADGAVAFASGMAALFAVLCGLVRSGETVAVARQVYGGVDVLASEELPRLGIAVRRFDPLADGELEAALGAPAPVLVHVETPTNPLARVLDVEAIAARAHRAGALVSVDATFLPPPLQRPLARGADLVAHSATKMLGGHADVLAGVVSARHALLERLEAFRRHTGAVIAPDAAWLLQRSLATLELRAERACANAERLARFLARAREQGAPVARVHYPGLADHPDHGLARRTLGAFGFVLAFEVEGGLDAAAGVYDRLRVIRRAVSLGGVESLASLPVHTSHAMSTREERAAAGIGDGLIRLSVGIEAPEELEADLAQALGL